MTNAIELAKNNWLIESSADKDIRKEISRFAQENDLLVLTMQKEEESLESVFKELTTKK